MLGTEIGLKEYNNRPLRITPTLCEHALRRVKGAFLNQFCQIAPTTDEFVAAI